MLAAMPALAAPGAPGPEEDDDTVAGSDLLSIPVVAGRKITASATLNTIADTNFRRRNDPIAGVRIRPALQLGAGLPVGRQQLFVGARIGRDFIINNSRFNRNRIGIGGGLAWRLGSRCSGLIGGEYLRRLNLVSDQVEFTENVQKRAIAAASANCQTATGIGAGVSLIRRTVENDQPERKIYNLGSTVISPSLSYGNQTLGQFSLGASFSETEYTERRVPTSTGFENDSVNMRSIRGGYSRTFGPRLQASVGLSFIKTTPKPEIILGLDPLLGVIEVPRSSFSGNGYDLSTQYQPSTRLSVGLSASRNVRVSANAGALFIVSQAISANADYRFGPKLTFGLGGARIKQDYKNTFASPGEPQKRIADTAHRVFASLDYSPVSRYGIGVILAHRWRASNPSTYDFKSTSINLGLRVRLGRE